MDNISKVFSTIMENPKLQQELAKKETIEEAYDYCISISGGYTIEEFKESLQKLVKMVNSMPEEQLEKISGGIKLNNRVLSTMLATISLASPLAGAAGSTKEAVNKQPSKINSFIKNVKDKVSKNPVESALATAGLSILGILSVMKSSNSHNSDSSQKDINKNNDSLPKDTNKNNDSSPKDTNENNDPPQNNINENSISSQTNVPLCLRDIHPAINRYSEIIKCFNKLSWDKINSYNPRDLANQCASFFKGAGVLGINVARSHVGGVKSILHGIDNNINTSSVWDVGFDEARYLGTDAQGNKKYSYTHIRDDQILKVDTTNLDNLKNIVIYYKTSMGSNKNLFMNDETNSPYQFTNEQKAIIIRYIQAAYLKAKGL